MNVFQDLLGFFLLEQLKRLIVLVFLTHFCIKLHVFLLKTGLIWSEPEEEIINCLFLSKSKFKLCKMMIMMMMMMMMSQLTATFVQVCLKILEYPDFSSVLNKTLIKF